METVVRIEIEPSFERGLAITLSCEAGRTREEDACSMELSIDDMPPVRVDRAKAEEVIALAREATVCPLGEWSCGLDGTTFRLTIEQGFSRSQFEWWCDLPVQWQSFRKLFAAMENLMRKTYPNYDLRLSPDANDKLPTR